MNITERFTHQHHEIVSLCNQLRACAIAEHIRKDARFVYQIQTSLFSTLNLHLRLEDTAFYPMLNNHKDPKVREVSLRLQEEFRPCSDIHLNFQNKYSDAQSIEMSADDYVKDTHEIINIIRTRINKEERELYSLLR